jgi:hypothetical protein
VAESGNFEAVKWLYEQSLDGKREYLIASSNKKFSILFNTMHLFSWDANTFVVAASSGDFEFIKWLYERECPWNERVFEAATKHGNLNIMKWIRARGCPWDGKAFVEAVKNGNMETIQWLNDHRCPKEIGAMIRAAKDNKEVMDWMMSDRYNRIIFGLMSNTETTQMPTGIERLPIKQDPTKEMIAERDIKKLETYLRGKSILKREYFQHARDRETAKWLLDNLPEDLLTIGYQDKYQDLNYVKWLAGRDHIMNQFLLTNAIQLDLMHEARKLIDRGCPISRYNLEELIRKDWLNDINYRRNVLSTRGEDLREAAASVGNLKTMKWLDSLDSKLTKRMVKTALINGNLDNLQWLKDRGHFKKRNVWRMMRGQNNKHVIRWVHENVW